MIIIFLHSHLILWLLRLIYFVSVENVMSLRLWEPIKPQSRKPGFIFTLMSYNVLAQDLLENHPYLYRSHSQQTLKWEIRWNNLLTEIKKINPDVCIPIYRQCL